LVSSSPSIILLGLLHYSAGRAPERERERERARKRVWGGVKKESREEREKRKGKKKKKKNGQWRDEQRFPPSQVRQGFAGLGS